MNRAQLAFEKLQRGERFPASAQLCSAPAVSLAEEAAAGALSAKVSIKAMTRDSYEHPQMGKCVHDFSTMSVGQKLALDWEHGDPIGYARPEQTPYGLEARGVVTGNSRNPAHKSNDALYCLQNEVPLQASIDWRGPYDLDFIPANKTAQINGLNHEGPCFVVKNWSWRALALCKVGVDGSSETQLNSAGDGLMPAPRQLNTLGDAPATTKEDPMPTQATAATPISPATPAASAPSPTAPAPAEGAQQAGTTTPNAAPSISQQNAVGDAAKSERSTILQAAIDACSKVATDAMRYCVDACKTALAAIGQSNADEELCEAGYAAMQMARELGALDTPEAITAAHAALKVTALVNQTFGWQLCSLADNKPFTPRSKAPATPEPAAPAPAAEAKPAEAAPAAAPAAPSQQNSAPAVTGEATPASPAAVEPSPAPAAVSQQNAQGDVLSQLNAERERTQQLSAKLDEMQKRIEAMAGGAEPVPVVPKPSQQNSFKTFAEALTATKTAHPEWHDHQCYSHARKQYPQLVSQLNSQPVARC